MTKLRCIQLNDLRHSTGQGESTNRNVPSEIIMQLVHCTPTGMNDTAACARGNADELARGSEQAVTSCGLRRLRATLLGYERLCPCLCLNCPPRFGSPTFPCICLDLYDIPGEKMDSMDQEAGIYFESYSLKRKCAGALNTS